MMFDMILLIQYLDLDEPIKTIIFENMNLILCIKA